MSDDKLPFQLDVLEYDWLILGTGYEESLFSAHLSKVARNSVKLNLTQTLVLDFGNSYSNNVRTMNFKEFERLSEDLPDDLPKTYLHKRPVFRLMQLEEQIIEKNKEFANRVKSTQEFKNFNIDMQPKLLFSHSPTVELMQQADMDQYMDFKAVEMQYFYDSKSFKQTPTSKSDIFKCQFLSLGEKKLFFQLLHTLVKVYHKVMNYQIDQNSTQEFDQSTTGLDNETYELYLKKKDHPAIEFLDQITKSSNRDKIYSILYYSICFQTHSFLNNQSFTTEKLIMKLGKYLKSMGVHSQSPFLYTNYGTGDIPQGFCRISAVYGAVYITQSALRIHKIEKSENDTFAVHSNLHDNPITIKKGILMSPQIYDSYKIPQQKEKEILMRLILVTNKETQQVNPSLYVIPCRVFTNHPIYIFRTDSNTNSCPKDYELLYCWTLLGQDQDKQQLLDLLKTIVTKDLNQTICYEQCLLQDITQYHYTLQPDNTERIYTTTQDNDDIDFDIQSNEFKNNIPSLNPQFQGQYMQVKTTPVIDQEPDVQEYLLNQLQSMKQ